MRALVVDDAAPMRALVRRALAANACDVIEEASDAEGAFALARDGQPAVIVLDGRLPSEGAAPLIERLRAAAPEAAIFVIATLDERRLVREAIAAGARGVLERPLRPRRLAEALAGLASGEATA